MKNNHCPVSAAEIKRDIDDTALITAQEIQEEEQREEVEALARQKLVELILDDPDVCLDYDYIGHHSGVLRRAIADAVRWQAPASYEKVGKILVDHVFDDLMPIMIDDAKNDLR
jgi:hypothetical protein